MEDILASIRRIIADDQALPLHKRDTAPPVAPRPVVVAPQKAAPAVDNEFETWLSETAASATAAKPTTAQTPAANAVRPSLVEKAPPAERDSILEDWDDDPAGSGKGPDLPHLSVVSQTADEPDEIASHGSDETDDELDAPVTVVNAPSPLLSTGASTSVSTSFQALAQTVMMQNSGMIEQSIREMLRPMLKQWLDDNLPTMVERLVRAEIERVARGGP